MNKQKNTQSTSTDTEIAKIRLDKWLWACRFYKTRAIAKQAIEGGKVHYEGTKPKTGKIIKIGDKIKLRQGFDEKTVEILILCDLRKNATFAQTLYSETPESLIKRQEITQMRRLSAPSTQGKPDKKQRRQIHRFKNES